MERVEKKNCLFGDKVDFLVQIDGKAIAIIEVKWSDSEFSKHLFTFEKYFPTTPKIQLVGTLQEKDEKTRSRLIEMRSAPQWLAHFSLLDFL